MRGAAVHSSGARSFAAALVAPVLLALQFGLADVLSLKRHGFSVFWPDLARILAGHAVLGLLLSAPIALFFLVAARAGSRHSFRTTRPNQAVFLSSLLVLGGLYMNAKVRGRFDLGSLRDWSMNLGLLAFVGSLGLVLGARAWSLRLVRVLFAGVLALDLAVATWALDAGIVSTPRARPAARTRKAPNVFVVLLDTLRADHLGAYGYPRKTSPRMDELAREAVLFERAYSTSNWTRPAVASLHTSTLPSRHGVTDQEHGLPTSLSLLAECLRGGGYRTGFFSVGANTEPADGYWRGVDHFYFATTPAVLARTTLFANVVFGLVPPLDRALAKRRPTGGSVTADPTDPENITYEALRWAQAAEKDRPLFAYIHYMGPHRPYSPPSPFDRAFSQLGMVPRLSIPPEESAGPNALTPEDRGQMIAQYDAEILWHDGQVGALLDGLRQAGRLDDAVVVLTADHGEAFGEHGLWAHGTGLFEEIVHIPLIVWRSGSVAGLAGRVALPVSLQDIAPTLTQLALGKTPSSFEGESLVPLLQAGAAPDGDRMVLMENPLNSEWGLRSRSWAYQEIRETPAKRWLYSASDPKQERELGSRLPDVADALSAFSKRAQRKAGQASPAPRLELDEARRERLRALGYLR